MAETLTSCDRLIHMAVIQCGKLHRGFFIKMELNNYNEIINKTYRANILIII